MSPDRFQTPDYLEPQNNSNLISGRGGLGESFNICGQKVIANPRPNINRPKSQRHAPQLRSSKQKTHNVTPLLGTEELVSPNPDDHLIIEDGPNMKQSPTTLANTNMMTPQERGFISQNLQSTIVMNQDLKEYCSTTHLQQF